MLWPEGLSLSSDLPEVLWYFSHYPPERRLVLAQNPNFYAHPPPPAGYVGTQPIDMNNAFANNDLVFDVLTNEPPRESDVRPRLFLELNPQPRIFDNIWIINDILILKGLCFLFLFLPRLTSSRCCRKAREWNYRGPGTTFSRHQALQAASSRTSTSLGYNRPDSQPMGPIYLYTHMRPKSLKVGQILIAGGVSEVELS